MLDAVGATDEAGIPDDLVIIDTAGDTADIAPPASGGPPGVPDPFERQGIRIVPVRERTISKKPEDDGRTVAVMVDRRRWRRLLYVLVMFAAAYWYFVASSLVIARVVPTIMGWETAAVVSGSMMPVIEPGDVVAYADYEGGDLRPGVIIAFRDRGRDELVTHRIVGTDDEGNYLTKGDANAHMDSTPLEADQIMGVARLVVPNAGLPTYWLQTDATAAIVGWAVITIAALVILRLPDPSAPPIVRVVKPNRPKWLQPAITVPAAGIVITMAAVGWTLGSFMDLSGNGANQFQAAAVFPPRYVEALGSAACSATSTSVVTAGNAVPAGNTVVVHVTTRDGAGTAITVADGKGNTYQEDAFVKDGRLRQAVFSARVTTALAAGDTITVSHGNNHNMTHVAANEYAGIADSNRVAASTTALGKAFNATLTTSVSHSGDVVAVGAVGVDHSTVVTPATGWTSTYNLVPPCSRPVTAASSRRPYVGPTNVTYNPSWDKNADFVATLVVYRG